MAREDEEGYVFRARHPEREAVYAVFDHRSQATRQDLSCRLDLPYGDLPRERFDLFPGTVAGCLLVFVHGGYWQGLSKERFSFVARAFVEHGFSVALPTYPLAPEATVREIVATVRRSVPAIVAVLHETGRRPSCWIASGHSAGGHLAAMLALTRWSGEGAVPPLVGCAPISGIFDLQPLVGTSIDAALRLDPDQVACLSPARSAFHGGRMTAVVGSDETAAFIQQTDNYVARWRALGGQAEEVRLASRNHYTILADLLEKPSKIVEKVVAMVLRHDGNSR